MALLGKIFEAFERIGRGVTGFGRASSGNIVDMKQALKQFGLDISGPGSTSRDRIIQVIENDPHKRFIDFFKHRRYGSSKDIRLDVGMYDTNPSRYPHRSRLLGPNEMTYINLSLTPQRKIGEQWFDLENANLRPVPGMDGPEFPCPLLLKIENQSGRSTAVLSGLQIDPSYRGLRIEEDVFEDVKVICRIFGVEHLDNYSLDPVTATGLDFKFGKKYSGHNNQRFNELIETMSGERSPMREEDKIKPGDRALLVEFWERVKNGNIDTAPTPKDFLALKGENEKLGEDVMKKFGWKGERMIQEPSPR